MVYIPTLCYSAQGWHRLQDHCDAFSQSLSGPSHVTEERLSNLVNIKLSIVLSLWRLAAIFGVECDSRLVCAWFSKRSSVWTDIKRMDSIGYTWMIVYVLIGKMELYL